MFRIKMNTYATRIWFLILVISIVHGDDNYNCQRKGCFPHVSNQTKYYRCSVPQSHGILSMTELECPKDYSFNQTIMACTNSTNQIMLNDCVYETTTTSKETYDNSNEVSQETKSHTGVSARYLNQANHQTGTINRQPVYRISPPYQQPYTNQKPYNRVGGTYTPYRLTGPTYTRYPAFQRRQPIQFWNQGVQTIPGRGYYPPTQGFTFRRPQYGRIVPRIRPYLRNQEISLREEPFVEPAIDRFGMPNSAEIEEELADDRPVKKILDRSGIKSKISDPTVEASSDEIRPTVESTIEEFDDRSPVRDSKISEVSDEKSSSADKAPFTQSNINEGAPPSEPKKSEEVATKGVPEKGEFAKNSPKPEVGTVEKEPDLPTALSNKEKLSKGQLSKASESSIELAKDEAVADNIEPAKDINSESNEPQQEIAEADSVMPSKKGLISGEMSDIDDQSDERSPSRKRLDSDSVESGSGEQEESFADDNSSGDYDWPDEEALDEGSGSSSKVSSVGTSILKSKTTITNIKPGKIASVKQSNETQSKSTETQSQSNKNNSTGGETSVRVRVTKTKTNSTT